MDFIRKNIKGYTLVEVIVAIGIFSLMLTITSIVTVNFYNTQKKERIRNLLIEESQFLMNRVANTIRNNTISYSAYYSNNKEELTGTIVYGDEPKEYEERFFYLPTCEEGEVHGDNTGPDGIECDREDPNAFNEGYFNTYADKERAPSIGDNDDPSESALQQITDANNTAGYEQRELYLVNSDGTERTILKRIGNGIDDNEDGNIDEDEDDYWNGGDGGERLGILQIVAHDDLDSDGELDFVTESENFQADGDTDIETEDIIPISPLTIDIVDLQFFIAPLDDPRKAFAETGKDVQIQPHVTILMKTRPGKKYLQQIPGEPFDISIQTTVTSRTLTNILFPDP